MSLHTTKATQQSLIVTETASPRLWLHLVFLSDFQHQLFEHALGEKDRMQRMCIGMEVVRFMSLNVTSTCIQAM